MMLLIILLLSGGVVRAPVQVQAPKNLVQFAPNARVQGIAVVAAGAGNKAFVTGSHRAAIVGSGTSEAGVKGGRVSNARIVGVCSIAPCHISVK